jgi:hypothetical protein
MRQAAEAEGVPIEVVGDGPAMFGRPVVEQAQEGPIVEVLRDRFAGSSEDMNAAGRSVVDGGALAQVEADAAVHERQLPDAALLANIAGTNPSASRTSTLDETIGGEQ